MPPEKKTRPKEHHYIIQLMIAARNANRASRPADALEVAQQAAEIWNREVKYLSRKAAHTPP